MSSVSFVKASSVSASPTSLDFGSVTYGSNKSETVTATYMLSVSGDMTVSCTGDFSATISGSCDCVNSHQTKTITVTITPSKAGTRSGTLTISNPDGTSTSVSLTGTGKRQDQTLTMANGQVNATTDKSNPTRLDLSTLCTQVGNGTVTYALVEAPTALDGTSAADSYVINGKYFHAWVAGTYTLSASASKTDQYNATTSPQQFTVTVNRVNNTLSLYKTVDARYVEETVNNAVSTNSNATINWSTSDGSLAYYDVAQNKIFIPNSNNQSFDTKVVTLKVWQDATDVYASGEKTLTLTVKKYDNTIVIAGFDDNDHVEHQIKTDWYDNELTISASNTDYAHYPINNDRTQGDDTQASFGRQEGTTDKWVVYTAQNTGIVRWRLWQEENYKYKAGDTTFAVNVIAPPCGCVLNEWHWEDGLFTNPPTASEIDSLGFGGIGETITFDARSNKTAENQLEYSFYTNGKWSSSTKTTTESMLYYNTVGPITLGTGDQNTTAVRFHNSGLWLTTDDPFIRDIVVTRKRWMKILDGAGKSAKEITSLPTMERFIDEDAKVATFYVDFSTCDKLVKVASDYGHVTFKNNLDRDTISENTAAVTTRGYNDKVRVDLYYYSDVAEEKDVTITIYTEFENKKITVKVKTVGYIFEGTVDNDWTKASNWNVNKVPTEINDVTIEAPALIQTQETVHSMIITTGSVTIAPQGGLTVGAGGISGATEDNLILKADANTESKTKGQTGYLRISPDYAGSMPEATVELFSIAYKAELFSADTRATWQYVGSPLVGGEAAKPIFKNSYIYNWNESTGEWENNRKTLVLHPFEGYATTQYKNNNGMLTTFAGQLADNQTKVIPLKYDEKSAFAGCNIVANSFTAPIDIAKMDLSDFSDGVEATIYIFNTGSSYQVAKGVAGAGQYTEIPVAELKKMAKGFSLPTVIPAMQGFLIKTTKAGSLTLDYSRIIMDDDERHSNTPLHAKRKNQEKEEYFGTLRVSLEANGWRDFLYILESDEYVADYENGSDTHKMLGGTVNIFAMDGDDALGVDATNSIIGTRIGVRTADTTAYVMSFSHLRSDKELLLLDNETEQTIKINEGTEYSFFAQPNSMITDRFVIIEGEKAPEITTGLDSTMDDAKVHKFIKDNQLYILKNGVLYNAVGARVH